MKRRSAPSRDRPMATSFHVNFFSQLPCKLIGLWIRCRSTTAKPLLKPLLRISCGLAAADQLDQPDQVD
jgi:hypothetical protein